MDGFRERVARGDLLRGLWQGLPGPLAAEIAGDAGFDWLLLDGEHGPWDPSDLRARAIAARATGTPVGVRVPTNETWLIRQALEVGPDFVMVPMVGGADAARAAVAASRYPPHGVRGQGAAITRAGRFGRRAEPAASLWLQVESRAALDDLEAICAVDGVDVVFIGPADLGYDMGHPEGGPEVDAACADAIARIRAAGRPAGIFGADPERWVGEGATLVAMGADATILAATLGGLAGR